MTPLFLLSLLACPPPDNKSSDTVWFVDADSDGWGAGEGANFCDPPMGAAAQSGDCDDAVSAANPGALEICDLRDNDCDEEVDEDSAPTIWHADVDGDGYGSPVSPITACVQPNGFVTDTSDCDDGKPLVHPGADEACNDDDDDCDGEVDEDVADPTVWYADTDGDTFGDPGFTSAACDAPVGYVGDATDCDDADATTYPGAIEVDCEDPVDRNCDGSIGADDLDADGAIACEDCDDCDAAVGAPATWYADVDVDGYGDDASAILTCTPDAGSVTAGGDCDEADATRNPGMAEVCGDGIDQDCDGSGAGCGIDGSAGADTADAIYAGEVTGDAAGSALAGNGVALLIGAPGGAGGAVYALYGPTAGALGLGSADWRLDGESALDGAGTAVAWLPDLDNDGVGELLVGAPGDDDAGFGAGAVYLVYGGPTGITSLADADAKITGEDGYDAAGTSVVAVVDVDGDGLDDLLVGAVGNSAGGAQAGAAYVVTDLTSGSLASAAARMTGVSEYDEAGTVVAGGFDWDGDGLDDLAVDAPCEFPGANPGHVYLLLATPAGTIPLSDADVILTGEDDGDGAGRALAAAGDVDGDGLDDLLVGAPYRDGSTGSAYVVSGGTLGDVSLSGAAAILVGVDAGDTAGMSVAAGGDLNADGALDLLLGAPGADGGAANAGAVYAVFGPLTGTIPLGFADGIRGGLTANDAAGTAVSMPGDLDGNTFGDVLFGAPGGAGTAYLVLDEGM